MEKVLLKKYTLSVFVFLCLGILVSCQSTSKKKLEELRKQTQIENPFEIKAVKGETITEVKDDTGESLPSAVNESVEEQEEAAPVKVEKKENVSKTSPPVKPEVKQSKQTAAKPVNTPKTTEVSKTTVTETKTAQTQFPFSVGEEIVFSVSYIGVEAGKFTFEVKPFKVINNEKTFHFYVSATTSSVFSMFYSVKDYAESFWSVNLKRPFLMKIYGKESRYIREVQTSFDWKKMTARYQAKILKIGKKLDKEDKTWQLNSQKAQDMISGLYYLRTFDLKVGQTHHIRVAEKGKDIVVKAEVLRREDVSTKDGKVKALVVKPTFTVDGSWKQMGDILIWLTDDDKKLPVRFEAKIKIGTIKGRLHSLKRS